MILVSRIKPTPSVEKTIVLVTKTQIDGKTHYFDFVSILGNPEVARTLNSLGERVRADSTPEFEYPFVTAEGANVVDFTPVYECLNQLASKDKVDTAINLVFQAINKENPNTFVREDVAKFAEAMQKFKDYAQGTNLFRITIANNFLNNFQATSAAIAKVNDSLGEELSFISSGINKTNFMRTPQDKVFIKLPAYEELYTMPFPTLIPEINEVFTPYKNKQFFYPDYKKYMSKEDNEIFIVGNPDNNDLGIQDNEMEFYNAMKELIEYGVKQAFPDKDKDECIKQNVGSLDVRDFLISLAIQCAKWNWMHTGYLSFKVDEEHDNDEDDSGSDSDSGALESNKSFLLRGSGVQDYFDGDSVLRDYIVDACANNIYAPAEAVIKLLRWGSRKPSRLKLEGAQFYLILNTFRFDAKSGSFANLQVEKVDGCNYVPQSIIVAEGKFPDNKYLQEKGITNNVLNVPVGMTLLKSYNNGDKQLTYVSMVDIVMAMLRNDSELSVAFLNMDDKGIHCEVDDMLKDREIELEDAINAVRNDVSSTHVFYRSAAFKDLYMKYKVPALKNNHLAILQDFLYNKETSYVLLTQTFESHEDLVEKVSNLMTPVQKFLDANIARELLPIVLNVAAKQKLVLMSGSGETSLSQVLSLYREVILSSNYTGDCSFLNEEAEDRSKTTNSSAINNVTDTLNKMNSFTKEEDNTSESASVESNFVSTKPPVAASPQANMFDISSLIEPVSLDELAIPLVAKDGTTVVATVGYAVKRTSANATYYVFAKPDVKFNNINKGNADIMQLIKFIFDALYKVALNKPEKLAVKFNTPDTIAYFTDYFNKRK